MCFCYVTIIVTIFAKELIFTDYDSSFVDKIYSTALVFRLKIRHRPTFAPKYALPKIDR